MSNNPLEDISLSDDPNRLIVLYNNSDPAFSFAIRSITVEAASRGETVGGSGCMFVSTDKRRTFSGYEPGTSISLARPVYVVSLLF
jgi:hypothetical protein